jgi:hypothetical protein
MQNRIQKKIETYITEFKDNIREKAIQLGINETHDLNSLFHYIYDYERLELTKEDFMKRKRVKNVVHLTDRCCAKRATGEQCTRRKKEGYEYCGTHIKGTPHGICVNDTNNNSEKEDSKKIEVWVQEIKGISYYIDKNNNVYQTEDTYTNKSDPRVIAKYVKNGDEYSIPEFNI